MEIYLERVVQKKANTLFRNDYSSNIILALFLNISRATNELSSGITLRLASSSIKTVEISPALDRSFIREPSSFAIIFP